MFERSGKTISKVDLTQNANPETIFFGVRTKVLHPKEFWGSISLLHTIITAFLISHSKSFWMFSWYANGSHLEWPRISLGLKLHPVQTFKSSNYNSITLRSNKFCSAWTCVCKTQCLGVAICRMRSRVQPLLFCLIHYHHQFVFIFELQIRIILLNIVFFNICLL